MISQSNRWILYRKLQPQSGSNFKAFWFLACLIGKLSTTVSQFSCGSSVGIRDSRSTFWILCRIFLVAYALCLAARYFLQFDGIDAGRDISYNLMGLTLAVPAQARSLKKKQLISSTFWRSLYMRHANSHLYAFPKIFCISTAYLQYHIVTSNRVCAVVFFFGHLRWYCIWLCLLFLSSMIRFSEGEEHCSVSIRLGV